MLQQALIEGVIFGVYFALVGLGLNLIFGVMRVVNMAHGDFLMLGGYSAYWLFTLFGLNPFVSALVVLVVFFVVALPLYYLLVPRLAAARDAEMLSLIVFFGFSAVIEALATTAFGTAERAIPVHVLGVGALHFLGTALPKTWVLASAVSVVAILATTFYLYATELGTFTRAIMASSQEAEASGIDTERVRAFAFGIGIALAGLAGVFAPFMLGALTPSMGVGIDLIAFAVITVGSLGNPIGTVLGGIIYGVSLLLMESYLSSWSNLLPNVMLIVVLLIWPAGILGRTVRGA